ncbi:MAG TPA: ABC transporter permease [Rectinemataceae bacterium]|nr:ABC transporter permease [Rectinemataceae bacterium]
MKTRIVLAIARKDALDLWLNKGAMVGLIVPIFLSLVWLFIGAALAGGNSKILVYNPGDSSIATVLSAGQSKSQLVEAGSEADVARAFSSGWRGPSYALGLALPKNLDASLAAGNALFLRLYVDRKQVARPIESSIVASMQAYGRALASPEPPLRVETTVLNEKPGKALDFDVSRLYLALSLLISLMVGTTFMPQILIEEKERKTLRMLMVSPASYGDILAGKVLVVFIYQLVLTGIVIGIQQGYTGQVAGVVLFAFLACLFSVSLGLLLGAAFDTVAAASAVGGTLIFLYMLGGVFVGPLGELLGGSPLSTLSRLIPTYYLADGLVRAARSADASREFLIDLGLSLASVLALLAASFLVLRRRAGAAASS